MCQKLEISARKSAKNLPTSQEGGPDLRAALEIAAPDLDPARENADLGRDHGLEIEQNEN